MIICCIGRCGIVRRHLSTFSHKTIDNSVILENVGGLPSHSLTHILNVYNTDDAEELNVIKHSCYFDQEKCIKIFQEEKNEIYTVVSFNTQSINFQKLQILLYWIQENNYISAIFVTRNMAQR